MRKLLLAGSTNAWLRGQATRRGFVRRSVSTFMPGERFDDALAAAQTQANDGIRGIFTQLGETSRVRPRSPVPIKHLNRFDSMKRFGPLVALWLACLPWPLEGDTYPRQPGVDAVNYTFRLTFEDASNEIAGEAIVELRFLSDGVRAVFLDLASTAEGRGMTVSAASSGGRSIAFTHQNDRLRLPLPAASTAGQTTSFRIQYRGIPADGLRLIPNIHGERTAFSENWPNKARQWLPVIDHPYDKATGELIVTAPAHYQIVANGLLIEETDLAGGQRRTHWKQSVPIASWLYAVGMARFAVHRAEKIKGVPLESWVFPQDRDAGYTLFEGTSRRAMEFFSERIGPYAYEKLANVQAAGLGGGTEHASAIFYGEKGVAGGRGPVVHEVAHQWWGNAVTERDWDDVWLSEGFATYFTLLYTEHVEGRDAFVAGLRSSRDRIVLLERKMPDTPVIHRNLSDMDRVLNQFVYQKGSWTLHMLRGVVGKEAFWKGIREYYRRYQNQNASTDEFRRVMEHTSGMELAWFFRQWLTRSGLPRIEGAWRYDAARHQIEVTLTQTQQGDLYRLPLEVGIVADPSSLPRIERMDLSDGRATFTFVADTEPAGVVLDPGTWLLMEAGPFTRTR